MRRARSILALAAVGAVLATGCAGGDGDEAGARTAAAAPSTTAAGGGGGGRDGDGDRSGPASSRGDASGDADTDVRIVDFAFSPGTVSAKAGQKVEWEHRDAGVTHTVAAVDGGFRSGELEEGDEFSHLFRQAGTFAYRCVIHPDMRGTVKVSG